MPVMWSRLAPMALAIVALVFGIDQTYKWWMLGVYDIAAKQPVEITSFFNLLLVWNKGISYGFLTGLGPWVLIIAQALICLFLWNWLSGLKKQFMVATIALVIGGALGNIADRIAYGAVADFFHLHAFGYSWYVFNLADMAIVAGAGILVYTSIKDMFGKTS